MNKTSVIIIGGGLSGLIAALALSNNEEIEVTILEKGPEYFNRLHSSNPDMLCGLGGAGTLGGGKLCFPPASGLIWEKTIARMENFSQFIQKYCPVYTDHLTSPNLQLSPACELDIKSYETELLLKHVMNKWIQSLITKALNAKIKIRCNCVFLSLHHNYNEKRHCAKFRNEHGQIEHMGTDYILFATGRTSTELLHRVLGQNRMSQPVPDLGIRLSLKRGDYNDLYPIGGDVKCKTEFGDFLARTFCVCSGGSFVKVGDKGTQYYDGHFGQDITDNVNLGILARSSRYSGMDAAKNYIKTMQPYLHSDMSLGDFIKYRKILSSNNIYEPLFDVITEFVRKLQRTGMIGSNVHEIPIMIPSVDNFNAAVYTDQDFSTSLYGVYVIGDAAGISRGFIQAMWAGQCAAEKILESVQWKNQVMIAI